MEGEFSTKERLLLFLYGTRHIVGCIAALIGLGLLFTGVIDHYWWAIVAGLYVAGYLIVPRDDTADSIARAELNVDNLRERLAELIQKASSKVPRQAAAHLDAIRGHVESLLPKLR